MILAPAGSLRESVCEADKFLVATQTLQSSEALETGGKAQTPRRLSPAVQILAFFLLLFLALAALSKWSALVDLQGDRLNHSVNQAEFEDYVAFYAAGELVREGHGADLYDTDIIAGKEHEVMGRPVGGTGSLGFFNPPFVALFFAPITLLPVEEAGVALFVVNSLLVLWSLLALRQMLGIKDFIPTLLFSLGGLSLQSVFWLVGHGQFSMLLFLGFLGFFWFQRQGKPGRSGLALSLLLFKPQMAILPVLVLLWRRDWSALTSFGSVTAVLVALSVAVSGPSVLWDYPRFALSSTGWEQELGINVERMYGWNGLFATIVANHSPLHIGLTVVATVATAALVVRGLSSVHPSSSRFALGCGALVAGAILVNPHVYLQDLVLAALVIAFGFLGSRELRWSGALWAGAAGLLWLALENSDRFLDELSVNVVSIFLIGLLALLVWRAVATDQSATDLKRNNRALPEAA